MRIMACQPKDCLHLERHHIESEVIANMSVFFCKAMHDASDDSGSQPVADLKNVVQHLLRTFRPSVCCIRNSNILIEAKDIKKRKGLIECLTLNLDETIYFPFICEEDKGCLSFKR